MLTIRDLSKTYANGVQALKGVTLDIPNGMFGLLGPNGAGKSTLMRTIATLQDADAGSIRLNDLDVLCQQARGKALCSDTCRRNSAFIRRFRPRRCSIISPCSRASSRAASARRWSRRC
jgi:ABC-type phosphate/phosphonate transport system ATPase subunit